MQQLLPELLPGLLPGRSGASRAAGGDGAADRAAWVDSAVAHYASALQVFTLADFPVEFAGTSAGLATALSERRAGAAALASRSSSPPGARMQEGMHGGMSPWKFQLRLRVLPTCSHHQSWRLQVGLLATKHLPAPLLAPHEQTSSASVSYERVHDAMDV